jgi:hypothetical protein
MDGEKVIIFKNPIEMSKVPDTQKKLGNIHQTEGQAH